MKHTYISKADINTKSQPNHKKDTFSLVKAIESKKRKPLKN